MTQLLVLAQVLLTFTVEGPGAVRFGFPLPAAALGGGLRLEGVRDAVLQWRPLHASADPLTGRRWCEVVVAGPGLAGEGRKTIRLRGGGEGASDPEQGPACRRRVEVERRGDTRCTITTWEYCDGSRDRCSRVEVVGGDLMVGDERLGAGEAVTETTPEQLGRTLRVRIPAREWARAGVIERPTRLAMPWRDQLCQVGRQLVSLSGVRGSGDYARSGEVVTNLEFDTILGFVRLALAAEDPVLLGKGAQSARHLVDHDLDAKSGLPFTHGEDHRSRAPEPGHVWLQGLLLAGCVFADDDWIRTAGTMARGLARSPRRAPAAGRLDRARDVGWPLLEQEAWLRMGPDPAVGRAAGALARDLMRRFDARAGVVRFGEGERRDGAYEDRAWLTGGILVPALRAYRDRTRDAEAAAIVAALETRLLHLLRRGRSGIPIRYWVDRDGLGSELRLSGTAEAFLMLEGLDARGLEQVLARGQVAACLEGVPRLDDPDVATQFSIAARCRWVLR